MDWKQCTAEAMTRNADIAVALEGVSSANALYKQAYSNFFPQLSASAGFTETSVGVANTSGSAVITGSANGTNQTYSIGLNATQSVFNGFQDYGKVKQGRANLDAAVANLGIAKATVGASLKQAFGQLLFAQRSIDVSLMIYKRQQSNLRLVNLLFEGGSENKGNLMYQAATVSQAKYQYEHSIRNKNVGVKQLAALLGRPLTDDIEVRGNLMDMVKFPEKVINFQGLVQENPTHQQAYYQRISADYGITIANQGWYPNLNLTGFVGKTGYSFPPDTDRWSAGISITFPFFPGTSQIFGSQNAYALYRQAQYSEASTDNKLIAGMQQNRDALVDAIEQVRCIRRV